MDVENEWAGSCVDVVENKWAGSCVDVENEWAGSYGCRE